MGLKFSPALRSARANQIKPFIAGGTLELRTSIQPANTAAPDAGDLLCEIAIPENCLSEADDGEVTLYGEWTGVGLSIAGAGTLPGHFRIKSPEGDVVMDGAVGASGQVTISPSTVASSQQVSVSSFTYVDGNR